MDAGVIVEVSLGVYDVVTVGSATLDVFAHTDVAVKDLLVDNRPVPHIVFELGGKVLINELEFMIGGGGTNTAVSFSRLGLHTGFLGCIGTDQNSHRVLELLHREQVDFLGQQKGQTGYSIVLDALHRDRTILTYKGSNNQLDTKYVLEHTPKTKWIYASSMIEGSFIALCSLIQKAKRDGVKIAFNPSSYQAKKGYMQLKSILDACDVLICNLEEAQLLFEHQGKPHHLKTFLQENPDTYVVITNGKEGATCYYQGKTFHQKPSGLLPVVETTGAGDAFGSGFVAGLIHGLSTTESLQLGMLQAESVIAAVGAKNNLMTKDVAFGRLKGLSGKTSKNKDSGATPSAHPVLAHDHTLTQPNYAVTDDQAFVLSNGVRIHSLEELGHYLQFMSEDVFYYHVTPQRNDFATWIADVFHTTELATAVRSLHDKEEASKKVLEFLEE